MFETGVVRANECYSLRQVRVIIGIFSILSNMKVCCVFSLESPHRGDSNECSQYNNNNNNNNNVFIYRELHIKYMQKLI